MISSGSNSCAAAMIAASLTANSTVTSWPAPRSSIQARWVSPLNAEQSRRILIGRPVVASGDVAHPGERDRQPVGIAAGLDRHRVAVGHRQQVGLQALPRADRLGQRRHAEAAERRADVAEAPAAAKRLVVVRAAATAAEDERKPELVVAIVGV